MTHNFQKKISSLSPNKSYASAVIEHTDTNISIDTNTSSSRANNATSEKVPSVCNSTDKSPNQKETRAFEKLLLIQLLTVHLNAFLGITVAIFIHPIYLHLSCSDNQRPTENTGNAHFNRPNHCRQITNSPSS